MSDTPNPCTTRPLSAGIPLLTPAFVAASNCLAKPRPACVASIAGHDVTLAWKGFVTHSHLAGRRLCVTIGEDHGCVVVPTDIIAWLAPGSAGDERWQGMASSAFSLLVDVALQQALPALSRFVDARVRITHQAHDGKTLHWFVVEVHRRPEESVQSVYIGLDDRACEQVARVFHGARIATVPNLLPTLRIPVFVVPGCQCLSADEIARLCPGDVIMLERTAAYVLATDRGRELFELNVNGTSASVVRRLGHQAKGSTMDIRRGAETCAVDRLPLELSFELARLEMTIGELRDCAEGTVLALAGHLGEVVDIRVHGQRIGKGTLVCIGDGLGVRITQLHRHE